MTTAQTTAWPLPTTFDPRPYQADALQRAVAMHTVLDHGLGAGKTTTALATLETLGAMRVLVLCPKKVTRVWTDEVSENASRRWMVFDGTVPGQGGKPLKNPSVPRRVERMREMADGAVRMGWPFMAVVNYEASHQAAMKKALLSWGWDALICDESQHLAGAGSVTSKLTQRIGAQVRGRGGRVMLTTGTFMPHSPLSVYAQLRTLDTQILGTSWMGFKARYAKYRVIRETQWCPRCMRESKQSVGDVCLQPAMSDAGFPIVERCGALIEPGEPIYHKTPRGEKIPDGVREDREQELMDRIAPWVHRVSQKELDAQTGLVEAVPQLRTCTLDPAARKAYDALERDLIAKVADGTIVAANAMVNVGKLMMLTSGHYRDAESGEMQTVEPTKLLLGDDPWPLCSKAKLLLDELQDEDPREPIVVFYQFRYDARQIAEVCRRLGRRYGELSGARTDGLDGKWMSPDIDLLAVQWQAGSEGINLSRARHQIDYSLTFKLTAFTQAGRRLNRQGQTRHVTRRVLVCEDTVDETCFYALKRRQSVNDAVLARLGGSPDA